MKLSLPHPSLWTLDAGLAVKDGSITNVPEATVDNLSDFEDGTLGGFTAYGAGTAVNDGTVAHSGTKSLKIPFNAAANMVYKQIVGNNDVAVFERWFRISAVPTLSIPIIRFATTPTGATLRGIAVSIYFSGGNAALFWYIDSNARNLGFANTPLLISLDTWYRVRVKINNQGSDIYAKQAEINVYDASGALIGGRTGCPITFNSVAMDAVLYSQIGPNVQGIAGNLWIDDVYMAHGYSSSSPTATSPWIAISGNSIATGTPFDISENTRTLARMFASAGTIKYQYALNYGAWNGSWLTKAQLNAALVSAVITDHTNSLRLKAQFISDGTQECDIAIAGSLDIVDRALVREHMAIGGIRRVFANV